MIAFLLLLVAAPLVPGVVGRTKAVMSGRRGPPLLQLYYDLWKSARRGIVYSTTSTVLFRLAPVVLVASTVIAAILVPLDGTRSLVSFSGDVVAFAYLLSLGRFALVLGALDTGSSFEGMGASREVTFSALVEPGLFVGLAALGLAGHEFSLSGMLGESPNRIAGALAFPSAVMVALSLFALGLAECARVPVDDPATHLELTMVHEVMILDHSGPDLAMILYASALKLSLFGVLAVYSVGSVARPGSGTWGIAAPLVLVASLVLFGVAVGVVESVMARLRLPKVPVYLAGAGALSLFALILLLR